MRVRNRSESSRESQGQYDDWDCVLCLNHNYSFRLVCNRCHQQTKQNNAYILALYAQQIAPLPEEGSFPHALLLVINDDPWEELPNRAPPHDPTQERWINTLLAE